MFTPSPKSQGQDKGKVRKKWRLFHATDFESLLYPCIIFCTIFGLFPYKNIGSTMELSKVGHIVSTIVLVVAGVWGLTILFEVNIAGHIKFDGVPGALQCNCYYILGGVIAVITYVMTKKRILLFQSMLEVSSKLPPELYEKMSKMVHAKDIIGFLFILIQVYNCIFSANYGDFFLKTMSFYFTMLVFQMDMLYMDCVYVLKACLTQLNDNLLSLRELVVSDEPHLLRRIYHEQRNPYLLMELKALKKRHLLLSDTVHLLNTVFSMQVLTTIVMTFAEITFGLYFYIVAWQGERGDVVNLEKQIWFKYYITSVTYYSVKIVLIVWACDTGKDQAMQIGTTVHDVLISTSDKQVKDELQLFSLQILHRENAFTAKGLTVDATLLTAIVGSITTYLLILIQFLVTTQTCKEKLQETA
ncbi:PREDICTED: putative gustatory receptor 28b [Trachymyrmex cornetzi]|uniref:Gustatory receptor n=1 Tax=Trachymyrmex cornetzi TaxID=471704 RepID=A0A151J3G1_9HYME|nr:PREDICTED: putative gustatory receptor 28b [Trachymyrmex cornetzi]KYN16996.1 Putative gustatory receptor 28b [Trachymyrmex cornetzi]